MLYISNNIMIITVLKVESKVFKECVKLTSRTAKLTLKYVKEQSSGSLCEALMERCSSSMVEGQTCCLRCYSVILQKKE